MAMEDEYDPFEGTGQTAMEQAQARGDRSYSSIGSMVGSSDDGDGGSGFSGVIPQPERPSFLERVSSKLGNIFGGIEAPKFDIQKPEFDPTGFYRRTGKQLVDIATPGVKTPLGALPSVLAATKAFPNPVTTGLSLLNYASAKKPEIDSFVEGILGKKDKADKLELIPTPTVTQLDPREINALDPRSLSFERPSARVTINSRGDPVVDIPVEEANPAGLSQLQRSLDGLPVEGRGGGLGNFVSIASPTSRPDIPVPNYVLDSIARKPPELVNAPNEGLGDMTKTNAPNIGLSPDDFPLEYFASEPELGPYEQEVVSQNLADIIMQGMQNSTPSGGITDLRGGDNLAFFDTSRGVFGSIPNPINVLTNKNLAKQGNIYTSASSGGRGSKRSKGDLLNELSRSIGSAINFSGSNR